MLTSQRALVEYEKAKDALNDIIRSPNATQDQKDAAESARDDVISNFIQQNVDDVNARTAMFQNFITQMEQVLNDIGKNSPLSALQQLQGVVDQAKTLLPGANGAGAGGQG